jgi:hypothetical protein
MGSTLLGLGAAAVVASIDVEADHGRTPELVRFRSEFVRNRAAHAPS